MSIRRVIIMVGPPGVGKTHVVKGIKKDEIEQGNSVAVCSSDDSHVKDGVYKYDVRNEGKAHSRCLLEFIDSCRLEINVVICDNTNTTIDEIAPYIVVGRAYGYHISIVRVFCDEELAIKRNTHRVPAQTIKRYFKVFNNNNLPFYAEHDSQIAVFQVDTNQG